MKKVCPLPPASLVSDTRIRMISVSCAILRLVESQELAGGQDGCHFSCRVMGPQGLKAVGSHQLTGPVPLGVHLKTLTVLILCLV